jgi:hypothetical protein
MARRISLSLNTLQEQTIINLVLLLGKKQKGEATACMQPHCGSIQLIIRRLGLA